jgi:hypothetical protein
VLLPRTLDGALVALPASAFGVVPAAFLFASSSLSSFDAWWYDGPAIARVHLQHIDRARLVFILKRIGRPYEGQRARLERDFQVGDLVACLASHATYANYVATLCTATTSLAHPARWFPATDRCSLILSLELCGFLPALCQEFLDEMPLLSNMLRFANKRHRAVEMGRAGTVFSFGNNHHGQACEALPSVFMSLFAPGRFSLASPN